MNSLGLAETIRILRAKGYVEDFNFSDASIDSRNEKMSASDDDFIIDQVFRFDVMSDPDDQSVLYAIHSMKTGKKGILVNGFGLYSDPRTNLIVDQLLNQENDARKP